MYFSRWLRPKDVLHSFFWMWMWIWWVNPNLVLAHNQLFEPLTPWKHQKPCTWCVCNESIHQIKVPNDPCPTIDSITNIAIGGVTHVAHMVQSPPLMLGMKSIISMNINLKIEKKIAKFTINCIRIGAMSKSYICGLYKPQLWSCKIVNSIAT